MVFTEAVVSGTAGAIPELQVRIIGIRPAAYAALVTVALFLGLLLLLLDCGFEVLAISNFTLCADCAHGNRPSFTGAESPEPANALYIRFCKELAGQGLRVLRGVFGADMRIEQVNDGPVTIVL